MRRFQVKSIYIRRAGFCLGLFIFTLIFLFSANNAVQAAGVFFPEVRVADKGGNINNSFPIMPAKAGSGFGSIAADLGSDGKVEIIVGSGQGTEPRVYIYNQDGTLSTSFLAYAPTFGKGVRLATGDLNGDGHNEIITGTGIGGGPQVRVFDANGKLLHPGFFAYDQTLRGGVFVTVRDLDSDGKAEIITGAGVGVEPKVKVFSGQGELKSEFLAFDATDLSGVTVGTADIDADGKPEIVVGRASGAVSELKIFSLDGILKKTIILSSSSFPEGVSAQGADCNADGHEELLIGSNSQETDLRCLSFEGAVLSSFELFPTGLTGSVLAVWARVAPEDPGSLVFIQGPAHKAGDINQAQEIRVSLNEQRLYAYEYGILVKSFLISSGIAKYPTPPGNYSVQKKIPIKDYVWTYGVGSPDNYNLPKVKWNLQFRPKFYLHYAYWHNNFGHRMSHGCVNMPLAASEWIYNWANVGTPVIVE